MSGSNDDYPDGFEDPIEIPIDGILDLHLFKPSDIKTLVPDYLEECRAKGILQVRIIHGKGTGTLRRTVHSSLDRIAWVSHYRLATDQSSWGATIVSLLPC
jgi:dsDNA-specific endonuclease/ATPase MutS2